MAEFEQDADDKTEDATPERREEFRDEGQVVFSREIVHIATLAALVLTAASWAPQMAEQLKKILIHNFQVAQTLRIDQQNFMGYFANISRQTVLLMLPTCVIVAFAATLVTLLQTQFNFSWKRIKFDMGRMNPIKGAARLASTEGIAELVKSSVKFIFVAVTVYVILHAEWSKIPGLMILPIATSWDIWSGINHNLFWGVCLLLIVVGAGDYIYNFIVMERRLKMTKQEVKEEFRQRETDPQVKARLRRMARDILSRKTLDKTKGATVLITNPTHYSVALKYELGMAAPIVVAKGIDFLALRMREIAKEQDIPIVENRPLARALYASVEEDQEIPTSMYKAVSEVIKYIFHLKGIRVPVRKKVEPPTNTLN